MMFVEKLGSSFFLNHKAYEPNYQRIQDVCYHEVVPEIVGVATAAGQNTK